MMTPEYQRQIDNLDNAKKEKLDLLDKQLQEVADASEADTTLKHQQAEVTELKRKIKALKPILLKIMKSQY